MVNLEAELDKIIIDNKIPSLSIMILENGKILKHIYKGNRILGENDPITEKDVFHLGSCGKAFTAGLIFKLIEENKIKLNDRMVDYLPLDKNTFGDIRILHLLSHTAGLSANIEGERWEQMFNLKLSPTQGRDIAIDYLKSADRTSSAGGKFLYSNLGYIVLAQIVENIEKDTFENVISQKLFKPLGMNTCVFGPVGRSSNTKGPWPHRFVDDKFSPVNPKGADSDNPSALSSAGGISCSQADWAKFINEVLNTNAETGYFKSSSIRKMHEINIDSYTYGAWGRVTRDWAGRLQYLKLFLCSTWN